MPLTKQLYLIDELYTIALTKDNIFLNGIE